MWVSQKVSAMFCLHSCFVGSAANCVCICKHMHFWSLVWPWVIRCFITVAMPVWSLHLLYAPKKISVQWSDFCGFKMYHSSKVHQRLTAQCGNSAWLKQCLNKLVDQIKSSNTSVIMQYGQTCCLCPLSVGTLSLDYDSERKKGDCFWSDRYLRYIYGDKIWIHYYNQYSRHQSMEWKHLLLLIKRNFKI
jgi:hypothetical protein